MASGTINLGTSNHLTAQIKWTATANGTAANTSTVKVTVQVARSYGSAYTTSGTFKGSVTVGGTTKSISKYAQVSTGWVTVYTLTIEKAHNDDGTGTCYIAGTIKGPTDTTMEGLTVSNSATVTLDRIPRGANITAAPNFNDEDDPTISYSNPAGSAVSSLAACISLTGAKDDVPYREISLTGTSYTFNLTEAERKTLRAATTTSNSRTVRFYIRTVIGDQTLRNSVEKTLSIVNAAPTLTATVTDGNAATVALTGDPNVLVKYYSNASASATYAAQKEASVTSYSVTSGGKSLSTVPATFSAVESGEFKFTVTDSRGNTTAKTVTKPLVNYVKLSCNLGDEKPDAEGNFTLKARGNYFNGSFGAVANTLTVQYRHKAQDGEWEDWVAMPATASGNTYAAEAQITGLDYRLAHVFQVKAVDQVCNCLSVERTIRVFPLFDWGETDFKFNIPVYDENGDKLCNPYPVGSYYISANDISPASLFGGTWERIENRFLWGAPSNSTLGATGGEAEHTLTVDEMPAHTHTTGRTKSGGSGSNIYVPATTGTESPVTTSSTGGGKAHNNMPPYVTVAIWRRTE